MTLAFLLAALIGARAIVSSKLGRVLQGVRDGEARLMFLGYNPLSQVNVVYGSMTTAIIVMFSLEIGATLLLFGAQVISEFERACRHKPRRTPRPITTETTAIK